MGDRRKGERGKGKKGGRVKKEKWRKVTKESACAMDSQLSPQKELIKLTLPCYYSRSKNSWTVLFLPVWRIQNVLMRIRVRIPLFKLMRIRIQIFLARERKYVFFQIFIFLLLHNLTKLVMCNFLSYNAGGGTRVEG